MKPYLSLALLLACADILQAQERKPPEDSTRVSVTGCTRGRSLIVTRRPGAEPVSGASLQGRRFRLSGSKKTLADIRVQKDQFVEVTGLVRNAQLSPTTLGTPIGKGGRIRIGGGSPNRDPTRIDPARDPLVNEPVLDVESWRPLPERCPARNE